MLISLIAINHSFEGTDSVIPFISTASLHAVCPLGSVVSIFNLVTLGTFVKKVHESSMVLLGIAVLLSVFFGPVFCGWMCPLGSFQEFISKLGKKLKIHGKLTVPKNIDKYLRFFRYGILLWILIITARSGLLLFTDYDPYYALFNFWTGEVPVQGIIILLIVTVTSLVIDRAWCKYACPLGAILGLSNKIRFFKIRRDSSTCIDCSLCDSACQMNISLSDSTKINDHQCISCMDCTSEIACPINDTVTMSLKEVN